MSWHNLFIIWYSRQPLGIKVQSNATMSRHVIDMMHLSASRWLQEHEAYPRSPRDQWEFTYKCLH